MDKPTHGVIPTRNILNYTPLPLPSLEQALTYFATSHDSLNHNLQSDISALSAASLSNRQTQTEERGFECLRTFEIPQSVCAQVHSPINQISSNLKVPCPQRAQVQSTITKITLSEWRLPNFRKSGTEAGWVFCKSA
ncbi:hypothetical protein JTB14_012407 [Gonioctena quinquepunctata]|nr:hypothetical protein JTB14_012407 [Gonioctena quinquepunctata]